MKPISELEKNMGYYYLATPYSKWVHGLDDANIVAQLLTSRIMLERVPVFSPIAHTHGIANFLKDEAIAHDHDFWMQADKPMFDAAHGLLIADLQGWRESKGVKMEIDWCVAQRKPYWLLDVVKLEVRVPRL